MSDPSIFDYAEFDKLLAPKGPVAIVGQQLLKLVAISGDNIVFPPSYANPSEKQDDPPVYNIDVIDPSDPSKNVCVLDSIPSQANRMEPIFLVPAYKDLVPQYTIDFGEGIPSVSVLNIGHRLADAVFRGTILREEIANAFKLFAIGNATGIAKLGPTTLLFGAWDSRGTGVKVPRLINSIVRAFNVSPIRRSAQYFPPVKYEQEGLLPAGLSGKPADFGLADVPSSHKIGGVQVNGVIRRDVSFNLSVLRTLKGKDEEETLFLRRYILGISLVALIATPESTLRQGCQLVPNGDATWKQFFADGTETDWHSQELPIDKFANAAAAAFDVKQPSNGQLAFEKSRLKDSIDSDTKSKAEKKQKSAGNPIEVLNELVEKLQPTKSDSFSSAKTSPLTKIREMVNRIGENESSSTEAKQIASELSRLLDSQTGATERKVEMLNLFQSATKTVSLEPKH